ncbi:MAG: sodium:alanine symporter family protein [Planctomycetia bacterium]|nr:sodium:alanine symporter family protein [Planctomycetia bacterium]
MSTDQINQIIININTFVWGFPLIFLVLFVGILFTFRLTFLQIFRLPRALYYMLRNEKTDKGEVSSFAALCTALSATVGTGNIVGVATAIVAGGPGALFWMWVAAFFGMGTKFAEGVLAVKYREIRPDGTILGGPFYYIEKGMGKKWIPLASLFAFFGAMSALLGTGTFAQINSITSSVENFFGGGPDHILQFGPFRASQAAAIAGLAVTFFAAIIIFGGLRRIANVSKILAPAMILVYVGLCSLLLITNYQRIPHAVYQIVYGAFNPSAITGGITGSILAAMQKGIARGIFSNESGLGTAPIIAAAAQTRYPVRQGLVSMTGTFIDTIIVCTMTGISIVIMSSWNRNLDGIFVTSDAFEKGLPFLPSTFVSGTLMICLFFFAFTTCLGWSYYGERCLDYLAGGSRRPLFFYRIFYILAIFAAPWLPLQIIWNSADVFNGLMAFPNLAALIVLSGVVVRETKDYFKMVKNQKFDHEQIKKKDQTENENKQQTA